MSSLNVSPFFAFKRDRRRQARVVLVMGLVLVLGTAVQYVQLPTCIGTVAVADAQRIYLVGMNYPQTEREAGFLALGSPDGIHWSRPMEPAGSICAASAGNGRLYCLLEVEKGARQLNSYGEKTWQGGEDWKVIETPFDWTPTGLGHMNDRLCVFGLMATPVQSDEQTEAENAQETGEPTNVTLCSARRDDTDWAQGPTLEVTGGLPVNLHLITQIDTTFLYWQLRPLERRDFGSTLYRVRFDGTSFGPVESFDLEEKMVCVLTGDRDRTIVLASPRILGPWQGSSGPRRFVIENGRMTRDADIEVTDFSEAGLTTDDFTMTRFAERTWLVIGGRTLGLFFRGMYAFELDGSLAGQGVRIFGPSGGQIATMALWCAGVMVTLSLLVGSAVGFLRKPDATGTTASDAEPLYATVLERSVATGMDLSLVSIIPWVMVALLGRGLGETAVFTVLAFVVYATASESSDGRTLGKRIVGIQVLSLSQQPASVMQAFLRNLLKPVDLLMTGAAMILGSTRFQRLGDRVAGTVVVSKPLTARVDGELTDESGT